MSQGDSNRPFIVPTMTRAQREAIKKPSEGMLTFDPDADTGFYVFNGSTWQVTMSFEGQETHFKCPACMRPHVRYQDITIRGITSTLCEDCVARRVYSNLIRPENLTPFMQSDHEKVRQAALHSYGAQTSVKNYHRSIAKKKTNY